MVEAAEKWKCAGCGSQSIATERTCDCPTECLYKPGGLGALKDGNQVNGNAPDAKPSRIDALESENKALRQIVSRCAEALDSGAFCSPDASVEFMASVPGEIAMTVQRLKGASSQVSLSDDAHKAATACREVAAIARRWREFDAEKLRGEGREPSPESHIYAPPSWPSHAMLAAWDAHLTVAADMIERVTTERDAALPWKLFYGDGMNLGEVARRNGKSVYAFSPWLMAPAIRAGREAAADERERAAQTAYRICAETRHVTLGEKVAEAIRKGESA